MEHTHEHFMRLALDEARKAAEEGEVPVGAVLVHEGNVISSARNLCEQRHDPTAHSESLLLREGLMGSWHFEEATLYVTKEPCVMCAGAMINARLGHLVYGCSDTKGGGLTIYGLLTDGKLNHTVEVTSGILEEDSINLLQSFFKARRGASKSGSSK